MAQHTPLPWSSRPLYAFPDADPRTWASLRKHALDALLNTDLRDLKALRALATTLSGELGHGAKHHDQNWKVFRRDMEAVRKYALGQRLDLPEDAELLRELHALCQHQFELDGSMRSACTTLTETDKATAPDAPSVRTISAEVFWTVQLLKEQKALDVKRCRREECRRRFVDLKGYTESCSPECRVAYAQGR